MPRQRPSSPRSRLAPLLALLALPACDVLQTGLEDTLAFEYVSTDRLIPIAFATPIAAGLSVDVKVYLADGDRVPATISLARSTDQDVVRVTATEPHGFTLTALRAGTAEVEVVSAAGNDHFALTVADLGRVDLTYPGPSLAPATPPVRIAQGGTARFGFTLKDASARLLVGYGALPVTIAPTSAATEVAGRSTGQWSARFDSLGLVTLAPLGGAPLEVTVVPAADITSLALAVGTASPGAAPEPIQVGATTSLLVEATTDLAERVLGLSGVVSVATLTPEVCGLEAAPLYGDAAYRLVGLTRGVCEVRADLGGLATTATLEVR